MCRVSLPGFRVKGRKRVLMWAIVLDLIRKAGRLRAHIAQDSDMYQLYVVRLSVCYSYAILPAVCQRRRKMNDDKYVHM
jgi:hypothetical protein